MRRGQSSFSPPPAPAGDYASLAKAHIAAHGGEGVVLYGPREHGRHKPQQWRAWLAYFAYLDGRTSPRGVKFETYRRMRAITVPAEWPLEFDASAPPAPMPEPEPEGIAPARRRELAAMLRNGVDNAYLPLNERLMTRRPGEAPPAPPPFATKLTEGVDAFADRPAPTLGPGLAKILGVTPPPAEPPPPEDDPYDDATESF
jgi:hypothetical protein